uniref:Solute carrier family 22 member 18 n=1 Tax=Pavo cristatus TaxID=9049 RepID=A0A8C9L8F2_PAVCR
EGEEGAGRMKSESRGQSNAAGEVRRGQVILAAYLIVSLELTFLFMQFSVMPYLAKNLGLDSVGFGYLQTTFGVLQLVGVSCSLPLTCLNIILFNMLSSVGSVFNIREILRVMKFPGVMEIFLVKVLSGFPMGLFMVMFSIISIEFFGLEAVESGYLMSYFGVLQMVVQGLVIEKLTSRCTEQTLLRLSIFVFAVVGLGMVLMRTVWHYCIIVVPLVFAFNVHGTITDSILTKAVPSSDTGAMLGICASVQPLTRTVGPTLGVILYKQFGVSSFGYLQLIVNVGLFVYLLKSKSPLRETKSH